MSARLAGWLRGAGAGEGRAGGELGRQGRADQPAAARRARAGLVHVPINPLLKRVQVAHILADSGAAC